MRFFLFRSGDEGTAVELDWSAMGGEVLSVDDMLIYVANIAPRPGRAEAGGWAKSAVGDSFDQAEAISSLQIPARDQRLRLQGQASEHRELTKRGSLELSGEAGGSILAPMCSVAQVLQRF